MRKLILSAALGIGIAFAFASLGRAQTADPSVSQIREAAAAGHLDQAQKMIEQVLADRPNSAKAHYVQAELYAREGKISLARAELGTAERLNPGLTEFSARSVQELKAQLGARPAATRALGAPERSGERSSPRVPWGMFLILGIAAAVLFMLFRRRPTYNQYPAGMGPGGPGVGGAPGAPGYGPGPGYGPQPMGGGGLGSGIAGGLASGLAVGAGVVAGEELAHHFLDGGRREGGGVIPSAEANEPNPNSDMGGSDFGVNDPGSWDDGGGGLGGGGGDDWS